MLTRAFMAAVVAVVVLAQSGRADDELAIGIFVDLNLSLSSEDDPAKRGGHVERAAQRLDQNGHPDLAARLRAKYGGGLPPGHGGASGQADGSASLLLRLCDLTVEVSRADDPSARANRMNGVLGLLVVEAERDADAGRHDRCAALADQAGRVVELGLAVDVDRSVTLGLTARVEVEVDVTTRHVAVLERVVGKVPPGHRARLQRALDVCHRGRGRAAEKVKTGKGPPPGQAGNPGNGNGNGRGNGNGNGGGRGRGR